MKILLIEYCNFVDYPNGGYRAFAKLMAKAKEVNQFGVGRLREAVLSFVHKL